MPDGRSLERPPGPSLSSMYIDQAKEFFEEKYGLSVVVVSGTSPDEDMKVMARAKYFVESGGGFTKLMSSLVKLNGGFVVSPGKMDREASKNKTAETTTDTIPFCGRTRSAVLRPEYRLTETCTSCWLDWPARVKGRSEDGGGG